MPTSLNDSYDSMDGKKIPEWCDNMSIDFEKTIVAYEKLPVWHKARKAIELWFSWGDLHSNGLSEKQKKVKFSIRNGKWCCNINNKGWILIDSQQYVVDNPPEGLPSLWDVSKYKEEWYVQHESTEGRAVYFRRMAAIEYVASQRHNNIWFAHLDTETMSEFSADLIILLWINFTTIANRDGSLRRHHLGETVSYWQENSAIFFDRITKKWTVTKNPIELKDSIFGDLILLQDLSNS